MTKTLKDVLLQPGKRPQIVGECETLIDEEVASKSGFSGLAIKGVFKLVKGLKPGAVHELVDGLLDDFVARMEPYFAQWNAAPAGQSVSAAFGSRAGEIADALLAITDERAQKTRHTSLKSAYDKLRPEAKKNVESAIPRIGRLIERHANG